MISKQKISKYIGDLLFIHDCVIIPDFGGFVANPSASTIHKGNIFLPSCKQLVFNKNLTRNDGLLINYIAEKENISYVESQTETKKYVQELIFELKKTNSSTIERVGSFYNGSEFTLQFEQDFANNFLIDSYGLSKFSFPELTETNHYEAQSLRNRIDKDSINISIKKSLIRKALISIPVILALTITPFSSNITTQLNTNKASIFSIALDSTTYDVGKQIEQKANIKNAMLYEEFESRNVIEESKPETENNDTTAKGIIIEKINNISVSEKGKFYLIGGSFNNAESAEIQKQIYEKQGYSATVVDQGKNRYRVCLNIFETKSDANKEISRLRNENKKLQVWLLEI